ncbi:MAG: hypothetical protein P1V20_14275 [Verrucomicrobiales bacterium]|nr:hypothetical protein [Verrucomicrobiales bacterium]
MKSLIYPFLYVVLSGILHGQENDYPVATPTDRPDVVISPYDSTRRLDVAGLEAGSLAKDPVAKKIFRIPFSNPAKRFHQSFPEPRNQSEQGPEPTEPGVSVPPPPLEPSRALSHPSTTPGTNSPSWSPVTAEVPGDLLNFIYAFNQNSTVNDPDALLPFYADRVENYFGRENVSKTDIRSDRASYLKRFPRREYILDGPPELISQNGNIYEVMTRIRYAVSGSGKVKAGAVSDHFKIKRGQRRFEIVAISEAKTSAAPDVIPQEETRDGRGSVYNRFESEQINLFLDAFAASGEINEPSAMIDFMHPEITTYYDMRNPGENDLIKDRANYISRWPERKYWLVEKPQIMPVSPGTWDVEISTGYEVKNGSKTASGVAVSTLRLSHTLTGLKISSITSGNQGEF